MITTNISGLRKNIFKTMNNVVNFDDHICVTTKNGNVVILSETEYNGMLETIHLLSQKGFLERIKEGEKEDISKMSIYNPKSIW